MRTLRRLTVGQTESIEEMDHMERIRVADVCVYCHICEHILSRVNVHYNGQRTACSYTTPVIVTTFHKACVNT